MNQPHLASYTAWAARVLHGQGHRIVLHLQQALLDSAPAVLQPSINGPDLRKPLHVREHRVNTEPVRAPDLLLLSRDATGIITRYAPVLRQEAEEPELCLRTLRCARRATEPRVAPCVAMLASKGSLELRRQFAP